MTAINQLLDNLKLEANVFHNGQYCGTWAVDASGTHSMTFHVVSRGSCFLEFEGQTYTLKEGDAIFFPNDSAHKVSDSLNSTGIETNQAPSFPMTESVESAATGLVCGHFNHQHPLFDKLAKQLPNLIIIKKDSGVASSRIIQLILEESHSSGQNTNVLLNRLSDCLFYLLIRDHLNIETGVFAAFNHPQLSKAMDAMHQSFDQKLTLDQLAGLAAMSRSSFSSLFKDVVGETPMNYINQWRMAQAYRWLADENISTYDAALRCGYETEAAFAKAFKRLMGVGPGEVRAKR